MGRPIQNKTKPINEFTPLHYRVMGHRLGDGTFSFQNKAVWDNSKPEFFLELCKHLDLDTGTAVKSGDCWKIALPTQMFDSYADLYGYDSLLLRKDPVYLARTFFDKSEDDRLQVLCACFFDDGSSCSWRPVLFEDCKGDLAEIVLELWNSVFKSNAKMDTNTVTKAGTRMYHVVLNRDGFVDFYEKIKESERRLGHLAGFWFKEDDVNWRYSKATSPTAMKLTETRKNTDKWMESVLLLVENNKSVSMKQIVKHLGLTIDRCRKVVHKLRDKGLVKLVGTLKDAVYVKST